MALAGVVSIKSFAIFMASMVMFNEERMLSRHLSRWGVAAIVETRDGWEGKLWCVGCEKGLAPY